MNEPVLQSAEIQAASSEKLTEALAQLNRNSEQLRVAAELMREGAKLQLKAARKLQPGRTWF